MGDLGPTRSGPGRVRRVLVVGSGISGAATALRLCELDVPVALMSLGPARHAPSAAAQDGLSAALDLDGEGDSPDRHFEDCLRAGQGLCHHPPLRALVQAAPDLFDRVCHWGVTFEHSPGGRLVLRRPSGSRHRRTAYAGSATGRLLLDALDDQLDRWGTMSVTDASGRVVPGEPMLLRLEYWDLLDLVKDDEGAVVGVVAEYQPSGRIQAWPADAVCLATGGYAALFAGSSAHPAADGAAVGIAARHGAVMANADLVQIEPTNVAAGERAWLVGELVRAAGARLWVAKAPDDRRLPPDIPIEERDYLLERLAPELGNLPTAARAAQAIFAAAQAERGGEPSVYLDARGVDPDWLGASLGRLLGLGHARFGHDPVSLPWRVEPRVHRSLGGLWVDYEAGPDGRLLGGSPRHHATSLPGLYAVGGAAYPYHGGCRLGGQALLESLFGGRLGAESMAAYRAARNGRGGDAHHPRFERAENASETTRREPLGRRKPSEDPWEIRDELRSLLADSAGIEPSESALHAALGRLDELDARLGRARVSDDAPVHNQSHRRVRALGPALLVARMVLESALVRGEHRGSPARTVLTVSGRAGQVSRLEEFTYRSVGGPVHVTDAVDAAGREE